MATLQKQPMDVRLVGLDEKANPRVPIQPGIIVDGSNWTMDKDGRVKKRPGLTALAMLDSDGASVTGGRELSALGDELVLATRDKVYGRDAASGAWAPRGRRAYESARIWSASATNAPCDGVDSLLQVDSAVIGRYVLLLASGGNKVGGESESGWMLLDGTSGAVLQSKTATPAGYFGFIASDTGEATPRFIAFACEKGTTNLRVGEWDADHRGVTWSAMITDLDDIPDRNTYGLQPYGPQAAPYAVVRVAANAWLIAYQQTGGGHFVVRRLDRGGPNAFSLSTASTIESNLPSTSLVPAWSYAAGASTATVVGMYYGTLYYGLVNVGTLAVSGTGNVEPSQWTCTGAAPLDKPFCRGITGITVGATAYFFCDVMVYTGAWSRSIWVWGLGAGPTMVVKNAGLLCHANQWSTAESGEIALGVAHVSSWQPSAFILRLKVAAGVWSWMSIGAHLCAGDYAGRACSNLLPRLDSNALALGILNEPVSLGGPGTVLLKVAKIGYADASTACSQPAEIAGSLLMPGACLKSYDGQHVTEAAFPLGPETMSVAESAIGDTFAADVNKVLVAYPNVIGDDNSSPAPAEGTISATFTGGVATFSLLTPAGYPGVASWPAGTFYLDLWVRVLDAVGGHTYLFERGAAAETYMLKTSGSSLAWQNATATAVSLTDTWQRVTWSIAVKALSGATTADRLEIVMKATSSDTSTETGIFQVAVGGAMAPVFSAPLPVIETGTRLYRACLAWTDSKGRTQRSQICPSISHTNAYGRTNAVTLPMTTVTERSPVTNLDALIHPAVIEVYRTESAGTTFYKIGQITNTPNAADAVLYDRLTDDDLVANAQLYTTGNTVEMWPPIGCNIVASHQGRAFVSTIDNRVFFTAFATDGEGLAFAAEFTADTGHLPGLITALLSLDDKLAICSAAAVASLTGIGPELTGTPVYDSPMVIGTQFGPIGQRSCVRVPTGIAMVTTHGVYMMDRGLSFSWTGAQVNDDAPGSYAWTAATYTPGGDQIRFSTTGLVLAHDLTLPAPPNRAGQWLRWAHPTNVWAWAISAGTLYQLQSNGFVYQSDSGLTDYGTSYQEWIKLAIISPAGPNGWSRIYRAELTCDVASGSTLKLGFTNDDFGLTENAATLAGPIKHAAAEPRYGQCSRMTLWIGESAATATAGFTLDAIGLLVGVKGGLGRLGAANRMARST